MKLFRKKPAALAGLILILALGVWIFWFRGRRVFPELALDFGNGQTGTLRLTARGENVTGTLRVGLAALSEAPFAPHFDLIHHGAMKFPRINFPLPPGDHAVRGLCYEARSYRVQGSFPPPLGDFALGGEMPSATQSGYYILVVAGRVASRDVPPLGQPVVSAAPSPTSEASDYQLQGVLKSGDGANVADQDLLLPLNFCHLPAARGGLWTASFQLKSGALARQVVFTVQPGQDGLRAGREFHFAPGSGNSLTYSEFGAPGVPDKDWDSLSGSARIEDVQAGVLRLTLRDVKLKARPGSAAHGSITLAARASAGNAAATAGNRLL